MGYIPILIVIVNIFHTDIDYTKSAINLDDIRVNKMIIESAALLANAIAYHGGKDADLPISKTSGKPFKTKAWQNHPSCLWVKKSRQNYVWLLGHLEALIEEMEFRKGTIHSMSNNVLRLRDGAIFIPEGELTAFENCTPYKSISDPIEAYRLCMVYKWEHDSKAPKWTNREKPDWYTPESLEKARSAVCEFPWTGLRQPRSKRAKSG